MTELCEIMNKNGSDKGRGHHNYTTVYHEMFKNIRNEQLNIFELGLGTNNTDVPSNMGPQGIPGASLRGWREYFPNANIFGADVDKRILFSEHRIKTFFCDQTKKEDVDALWKLPELKDTLFDLIIDDGLHEFNANLTFLKNSIHKLKPTGTYICEDLLLQTVEKFKEIIPDLKKEIPDRKFQILQIKNPLNNADNTLLVIN